MKDIELFYGMMGFNRLDELKNLKTVHSLIDYVDHFIYVDGSEGKDGTFQWAVSEFGDKLWCISSKWSDDFPGQRNNYLNFIGNTRDKDKDTWVVVNDTDEVFSESLSKNIKSIIDVARSSGKDMVQVRCKSVTIDGEGNRVYENMDNFYKPLIFRYYEGMEYWGDRSDVTGGKTALHEALRHKGRFVWRPVQLSDKNGRLYYEHIKLVNIIWERGARNFIVFGGGPNLGEKQPLWKPFREMLSKVLGKEDYTSVEVLEYFKKGNIAQEIKDFMIEHKDEDGYDGSSEVRELYKTYFLLYNPDELFS